MAQLVKDGFFDGKSDPALVGMEVNVAGENPTDWVVADGFTDTEREGFGASWRQNTRWRLEAASARRRVNSWATKSPR